MLKKNRLCLLEGLNPEPVLQRLYQQNMMSQIILESIQALVNRYKKNAVLVIYLPKHGPKVFQLFCRALSASGQNHIRNKIQQGCVDLTTVITYMYEGKMLSPHKGKICLIHAFNQCNKLMQYIPEIQEIQQDHMESGCLSEWEDLVHQHHLGAVMAFSRPLFAEVCR